MIKEEPDPKKIKKKIGKTEVSFRIGDNLKKEKVPIYTEEEVELEDG